MRTVFSLKDRMPMIQQDAAYWIDQLQLKKHIEGGYFRENYRSSLKLQKETLFPVFAGTRAASTAIYFLLTAEDFSAFHRIHSDEIWHFYFGDTLEIFELSADGLMKYHRLGKHLELGEVFQSVVLAKNWFASRLMPGGKFALAGCTVAPGFDFSDFELADRGKLVTEFPMHRELILSLTR